VQANVATLVTMTIATREGLVEAFLIEGGRPLSGTVTPAGNKNAALPILAACLLTADPVTLENVPRIRDVETLVELLREQGYAPEACEELVHGTTVATNAILENSGASTGLITTKGFRDVLELRRLRVPVLYNLRFRPPSPIVERRLRLEVEERIGPDGETLTPLDEDGVLQAIEIFRREGVEAIAVHSADFAGYPYPLSRQDAAILFSHRGSKQYTVQAAELAATLGVKDAQPVARFTWSGVGAVPRAVLLKETAAKSRAA